MPTLLHIDSSPLGDASISRHLSDRFVEEWKAAHPGGQILRRDLTETNIAPLKASWIAAVHTPADTRTLEQKDLVSLSDTLIGELREAEEWVFGVPMHNFSVPSTLKLWIDQIARRGETFEYADGKGRGLLQGKKATFLIASGAVYDSGSAMAAMNFVEPYLRSMFGFLGVTDTTFIHAGGASALAFGQIDRPTFLQPHLDSIRMQFESAHV